MVTQNKFIAILSVILLSACSPQSPDDKTLLYATQTISKNLQNWQKQSEALAGLAGNYCANNESASLAQLQEQWQKTRQSWQQVQALPLGKLNEQSQLWQVHFWPDKKNLVQFQFIKLMQTTQKIDIEKTSTVLRGLGASEYLLFAPNLQPDNYPNRQTRCLLLVSNTSFQKNLAATLNKDWQQQSLQFTQLPNQNFASQTDALAELLRSEISAMEILKAQLAAPLPAEPGSPAKPFEAVFWRADASLDSFKQGLAAHESLWKNAGWQLLISEKNPSLAKQITARYAQLHQLTDPLNKSLRELLASDDGIKLLQDIKTEFGALQKAYGEEMAKTLGVQIGFNANDGD